MFSADTLLQRRFHNRRPGLNLIAIEDAAVPVTLVTTHVLAQERKALPLLYEFLLRLASIGVGDRTEIGMYLGVEDTLVVSAIAEQVAAGNIHYNASTQSIKLTPTGVEAVRDSEAVRPVHAQISVPFDRLTWTIADYPRSALVTKQEAQRAGLLILPPRSSSRIGEGEIRPETVNAMLRYREGKDLKREVLVVEEIKPNTHRYLPIKLLIFGDPGAGEVEVSAVVDGDASDAHDIALREIGGPTRLGIQVDAQAERPVLAPDLEAQRVPEDSVAPLRTATIDGRLIAADREAAAISDPAPTSRDEISLANIAVRSVGVFEHRDLLQEALESSRRRLLIISPWIKSAVVDDTFLGRLEQRLKKGVVATIAHGIGPTDKGSDQGAIDRLTNLSQKYQNNFSFIRLANTHAKVLIFDDRWISTSFNWLSFKGDPTRTYRMEEGTLVQIPGQVTSQYDYYVALIDSQRQI